MLRSILAAAVVAWSFGCATLVSAENGNRGVRGGHKTISARIEDGFVVLACREDVIGRAASPYGLVEGRIGDVPCAAGTRLDFVAGDVKQTQEADERGEARFSLATVEVTSGVASTPNGTPEIVELPERNDADVGALNINEDESPEDASDDEADRRAEEFAEAHARYAAREAESAAQAEAARVAADDARALTPAMEAARRRCLGTRLPPLTSDEPWVELRRPQRVPSMDRRTGAQTFPARVLARAMIATKDSQGRSVFTLGSIEVIASDGTANDLGFEGARPGYPDAAYPECRSSACDDVNLVLRGQSLGRMTRKMEYLREWSIEGVTVILDEPICSQTASVDGAPLVPLTTLGQLLVAWDRETRR